MRDIRFRGEVFARAFTTRPIHEVDANEIEAFLRSRFEGNLNRKNYRRIISLLFSFAVKKKYILTNPVREVTIPKVDESEPRILTLPETRALLAAADPDFLPVVAIGLFGGLRPEAEIWRLNWRDVDFKSRLIIVKKSKNIASRRDVGILDNLLAWLKPYAGKTGPVTIYKGTPFYLRVAATKERAIKALEEQGIAAHNLREWPNDCLRHMFASCHYAAFHNSGDSASQMGHSGDLRVFFRHYRGLIDESEAHEYWKIFPPCPEPFSVVAA